MSKETEFSDMREVKFSEARTFLGRNGWFKSIGLRIIRYGITTRFVPITSKGEEAKCEVEFPTEDIDNVIQALVELKESQH